MCSVKMVVVRKQNNHPLIIRQLNCDNIWILAVIKYLVFVRCFWLFVRH